MSARWQLDQQDRDAYRREGLLKSPFRIADEQLGRMRYIPGSHASGSVYKHRITDRSDVVLNQEVEPSTHGRSHE